QDFLEEEPLADLTVDQVYNSDADLQQAVAGIYADLSNDNVYRRGRIQFFLELRTDAMMLGGTQLEGERLEIATFNYSPSNGFITNLWDRLYNGINNANVLIEKAPAAAAASAAGKRRTVAEAHFLRAFMYFNLVRLWGAVPLVLDSPTTFNETRNATRTPVDQIYAQIIEDARTAAGEVNPDIILPEIGNNDGRLTLSAAQTLLAEVYLSLQNYAESARYAKQVIDGGTHALWPQLWRRLQYCQSVPGQQRSQC
ncbi:MAG: hypothetical protein HC880_20965, partial [Bacteroidia bacterium]|nr:hypothetical protein [Bacteroidia bacterium]